MWCPCPWTRSLGSRTTPVAGDSCSFLWGDARVNEVEVSTVAADPVRVLRAAVKLVAAVDLTELPDAAIAHDLVSLRRSMDRLDGAFARWSVTAQGRGVGLADGHGSLPAWLGWKTGVRRAVMNHTIRVGDAAELLAESGAAWRSGEISTGAMEAIASARVAGHDEKLAACEPEFLALARAGKHRELRQATDHFRNFARGDGKQPLDCNGLTLSKLMDGRTAVSGELHDTAAEVVQTALAAFMDPRTEGDARTPAQRRAEALVRMCEVALARGASASRARVHVTIVVDWESLFRDGFAANLADGAFGDARFDAAGSPGPSRVGRLDGMFTGPLHRRDVEQVLCDCHVSRVVMGPESKPLDVGRQGQSWPPAIRRAIIARDGGCQWHGCEVPAAWCDVHHAVHWIHGGPTSVSNGYLLCPRHHRFLHRHPDWVTTFEDQVLRVFRPNGLELHRYPWSEDPEPDPPDSPHAEPQRPEPMLV